MDAQEFVVKPIGYVRAGEEGFRLELTPEYRCALEGLDGFGHVLVLWWCHLYDEYREVLEVPQPYTRGPEVMGIFATRAPVRPNPIAVTVAEVQRVDQAQGIIYLPYMDAEDGTPILDIKPYHPSDDRVRDIARPAWCAHWPAWFEDSASFDWDAEFVNAH